MEETTTDLTTALLPADVLGDVLGRLPPRGIATSRCVCKAWRAAVDAHPSLREELRLLPRYLAGILVNFHGVYVTEFFSRPSTDSYVFVKHDDELTTSHAWYPQRPSAVVEDHCNGLVLIRQDQHHLVVNPATRWCARLPPSPPPPVGAGSFDVRHLVYDPAISPHYEVLLFPRFHYKRGGFVPISPCWAGYDPMVEQSEWPPSPCVLRVFSSKIGRWEERSFIREGEAAGTIADMRSGLPVDRNAVYCREAVYVHCQTDFVTRISLLDNKIRVIKPPIQEAELLRLLHLGKSEKGVYFALVHEQCKLKVWFLDESCGRMEWVLTHEADLTGWLLKHGIEQQRQVHGPWTLHDINYDSSNGAARQNYKALEEVLEWDSEDENLESYTENEDAGQMHYNGYIDILGFHPYKEIIILGEQTRRGLAYHLNSNKVQYLGNLYPTMYDGYLSNEEFIEQCFPYTPAWIMGPTTEK